MIRLYTSLAGLARGLGDDRLVAFAMDHDLPFAFALVTPRSPGPA